MTDTFAGGKLSKVELIFDDQVIDLVIELENSCTLKDLSEFLYKKKVVDRSVPILYTLGKNDEALEKATKI